MGWKLLEAIAFPSETRVALSLLSLVPGAMSLSDQIGYVAQILIFLWKGECFCRAPFDNFHKNDNFLCGSGLLVFNAMKQLWSERNVVWITQ